MSKDSLLWYLWISCQVTNNLRWLTEYFLTHQYKYFSLNNFALHFGRGGHYQLLLPTITLPAKENACQYRERSSSSMNSTKSVTDIITFVFCCTFISYLEGTLQCVAFLHSNQSSMLKVLTLCILFNCVWRGNNIFFIPECLCLIICHCHHYPSTMFPVPSLYL